MGVVPTSVPETVVDPVSDMANGVDPAPASAPEIDDENRPETPEPTPAPEIVVDDETWDRLMKLKRRKTEVSEVWSADEQVTRVTSIKTQK